MAIFAAASEAFSKKNTNCTIAESLDRFKEITDAAKEANVAVRGYVSCVVGCPYQGDVDVEVAADVASELIDMGCYEVSMADTTGVGTPASVDRMFQVGPRHLPCSGCCPISVTHLHWSAMLRAQGAACLPPPPS